MLLLQVVFNVENKSSSTDFKHKFIKNKHHNNNMKSKLEKNKNQEKIKEDVKKQIQEALNDLKSGNIIEI